jgi:hypothetical protein
MDRKICCVRKSPAAEHGRFGEHIFGVPELNPRGLLSRNYRLIVLRCH